MHDFYDPRLIITLCNADFSIVRILRFTIQFMNLYGTPLFWKESMMNMTSRFGSRLDLQFTQNRNESIV